jgi:hypothetical protein
MIPEFVRFLAGDTSDDGGSDGLEDEPTGLQSKEYASRSPADESLIASQHSQVSRLYLQPRARQGHINKYLRPHNVPIWTRKQWERAVVEVFSSKGKKDIRPWIWCV